MNHRPISGGILLAAVCLLGAAGAVPQASAAKDPSRRVEQGPRVTLTTGTGDGSVKVRVDGYGQFGTLDDDPNTTEVGLIFDPEGEQPAADTTYYSSLWFSGVGRTGLGGGWLLGSHPDARSPELDPIPVDKVSDTRAVSEWELDGLRFRLVQEIVPGGSSQATFRQTYTITNPRDRVARFDMIRHFDGDLRFDGQQSDLGGVSRGGKLVFEFENTDDPEDPASFVGVDVQGGTPLGYRIAAYKFADNIMASGAAILTNQITGPDNENLDVNEDGIADRPYDVTLSIGQRFSVDAGGRIEVVTNTILGNAPPECAVKAPSNLSAEAKSTTEIMLRWNDNSDDEVHFGVERKTGGSGFSEIALLDPNVTEFLDQGLQPDTRYTYRIRADSAACGALFSNVAAATTQTDNQPPVIESPRNGATFRGGIGDILKFDVTARDPDTGDTVTLTASGLPGGAVHDPPLPAQGNPVSSRIEWKADTREVGPIIYTADDGRGGVTRHTVNVLVGMTSICLNGEVGRPADLVMRVSAGWLHGRGKLTGRLRIENRRTGRTLRGVQFERLAVRNGRATLSGTGRVGARRVEYRLVVRDGKDADTLEKLTVDGEEWPAGRLRNADVHYHDAGRAHR